MDKKKFFVLFLYSRPTALVSSRTRTSATYQLLTLQGLGLYLGQGCFSVGSSGQSQGQTHIDRSWQYLPKEGLLSQPLLYWRDPLGLDELMLTQAGLLSVQVSSFPILTQSSQNRKSISQLPPAGSHHLSFPTATSCALSTPPWCLHPGEPVLKKTACLCLAGRGLFTATALLSFLRSSEVALDGMLSSLTKH